MVSKIGTSEIPTDPMPIESGDIIMVLKDRKDWISARSREELAEKLNEKMSIIPGVNLSFEQPIQMRFNELIAGVKSDIAIKIFGADLDKLFAKGNEVSKLIKNIDGLMCGPDRAEEPRRDHMRGTSARIPSRPSSRRTAVREHRPRPSVLRPHPPHSADPVREGGERCPRRPGE